MKTRTELLNEAYLNIDQIKRLMKVSHQTAKAMFDCANEEDNKLPYRVEPKKVRTSSVLKVSGIKREDLEKIIKGELEK